MKPISEQIAALSVYRKVFVGISLIAVPALISVGFGVQAVNVVTEAEKAIYFFTIAATWTTLFFCAWEEIAELNTRNKRWAMIVLGIFTILCLRYGVLWVAEKAEGAAWETMVRSAHESRADVMTRDIYEELKKQIPESTNVSRPLQKPTPKTVSFVFVVPGVWANGNTWDFIVNHRGPDPSYHVEILFVDTVKQKQVVANKTFLSEEDLNSYQRTLNYPEIDPKGRGSIFATQFLWTPPVADHEKYSIDITWRDGTVHQDLQVERVNNKWFWATQIKDRESGKMLVNCKDKGFPYGPPAEKACFPEMTLPGN